MRQGDGTCHLNFSKEMEFIIDKVEILRCPGTPGFDKRLSVFTFKKVRHE
jgi:hypothetical protein